LLFKNNRSINKGFYEAKEKYRNIWDNSEELALSSEND
jgi:hypothetical protein